MSKSNPPAAVQPNEGLGPLPEAGMMEADPYLPLGSMSPHGRKAVLTWYDADQMRAYASAAVAAERKRWEDAVHKTWQAVDPFKPAGEPGSYARGHDRGIVDALTTLRMNLNT